jgi:hypothetical protein
MGTHYVGMEEGYILTRSVSEGKGRGPSLTLRVSMSQRANLPCRGNIRRHQSPGGEAEVGAGAASVGEDGRWSPGSKEALITGIPIKEVARQ